MLVQFWHTTGPGNADDDKYGDGVPEDEVTAYAWYNLAAANGSALAKKNKADIAKSITPGQIAKGEALVKEMTAKNPKLPRRRSNRYRAC